MNIFDKLALHNCTSCQMCGAVCPKDAISIKLDEQGFYRPVIDDEYCIDCGLCTKVCYKFDEDVRMTSDKDLLQMPLYAAYAKDDEIITNTTSGGIADLLAHQLLAEGYKCIGVIYNDEKVRAEHVVVDSEEKIVAFRGSKYIQSYSFEGLKELVRYCGEQKYAVFGIPCQIYAVHRFLERKKLRNKTVLIDLYCHGCPSMHVWTKYQNKIKQDINKSKFDQVNFRSKVKGWGRFYMFEIIVEGIRVFMSSPKRDEFYTLFFSDHVLNSACHDCKLRSTLAYTDIRLGDFWGNLYATNKRGVSAVSLVTELGRNLFTKILPRVDTKKHSYHKFLPYQSWGRKYVLNLELREKLFISLQDKSLPLANAARLYCANESLKNKAKRIVKNMAYYLPFDVITLYKRFV